MEPKFEGLVQMISLSIPAVSFRGFPSQLTGRRFLKHGRTYGRYHLEEDQRCGPRRCVRKLPSLKLQAAARDKDLQWSKMFEPKNPGENGKLISNASILSLNIHISIDYFSTFIIRSVIISVYIKIAAMDQSILLTITNISPTGKAHEGGVWTSKPQQEGPSSFSLNLGCKVWRKRFQFRFYFRGFGILRITQCAVVWISQSKLEMFIPPQHKPPKNI